MSKKWQQFVSVCSDADIAAFALLIAIGAVVAAISLPGYFFKIGQYTSAVCLAVTFGGVSGICLRDYRRGRWSILSGTLLAVWVLITAAITAYACFVLA
jgi:hypothetical protein